MIYDIDFTLAVKRLLPPFLRQVKHIAWLTALVKPLQEKRDEIFGDYYTEIIKRMKFNGQTIVLEEVLNQFYNLTADPLIYIETLVQDNFTSYVGPDDATEVYVGIDNFTDTYIGTGYSFYTADFIIYVPSSLVFVEAEMRALVDGIKLYGTSYLIVIY
jgi:hypothetical protein